MTNGSLFNVAMFAFLMKYIKIVINLVFKKKSRDELDIIWIVGQTLLKDKWLKLAPSF